VGLLVFEGGLGLDRQTLAKAPAAVRGLLTVGVLVGWALTALVARWVVGLPWDLAILLGSMLIVTGPTVIQPILRRTPLKPSLHSALAAEGILIDPIGVVVAVATLEVVRLRMESPEAAGPWTLLEQYGLPAVAGVGLGVALGLGAAMLLRRLPVRRAAHDQVVVLVGLAACMIAFGAAETIAKEAGLVAATVCGMLLANAARAQAEEMRQFKETTSVILVGALFILLASRVDLDRLSALTVSDFAFVALLVVVVRPLAVLAGTIRSGLGLRERAFAALIAPRGIVAASLGSIVAIELVAMAPQVAGRPDLAEHAQRMESLVLVVIFTTVALAGVIASPLAGLLGVRAGEPTGVLIIGGHRLGRELARELAHLGVPAKLVDTNATNIAAAIADGVPTAMGDATDTRWLDQDVATNEFGRLVTLTDNQDVDSHIANWAHQRYGPGRVLRWRREKPGEDDMDVGTALQWGRPLRHLLFQMDADLARCASWTDEPTGALPICALMPGGELRLIPDADLQATFPDGPPKGVTIVGVLVGPKDTHREHATARPKDTDQSEGGSGEPADAVEDADEDGADGSGGQHPTKTGDA